MVNGDNSTMQEGLAQIGAVFAGAGAYASCQGAQ